MHFEVSDGSLSTSEDVAITVVNVGADELISNLIKTVDGMNIHAGIKNSLIVKLDNALTSVKHGNKRTAENILDAFVNEVNAQRGKKLTAEQAASLITSVEDIKENLNAGPVANADSLQENLSAFADWRYGHLPTFQHGNIYQ